jgi:hypothetical protein
MYRAAVQGFHRMVDAGRPARPSKLGSHPRVLRSRDSKASLMPACLFGNCCHTSVVVGGIQC